MGACFISITYPACTQADLQTRHRETCDRAAIESGRSYSGDWGSKTGLCFPRGDQLVGESVIEELSEDNEKWGPAFAVRKALPSKTRAAQITKAEEAVKAARARHEEAFRGAFVVSRQVAWPYPGTDLDRSKYEAQLDACLPSMHSVEVWSRIFREVKTKVRGCADCGSSLSMNAMRDRFQTRKELGCPLCFSSTGMLAAGDVDKQKKLFERAKRSLLSIYDLQAEVVKLTLAPPEKDVGWVWFVGGWAPS